jgi:hypothetical protein
MAKPISPDCGRTVVVEVVEAAEREVAQLVPLVHHRLERLVQQMPRAPLRKAVLPERLLQEHPLPERRALELVVVVDNEAVALPCHRHRGRPPHHLQTQARNQGGLPYQAWAKELVDKQRITARTTPMRIVCRWVSCNSTLIPNLGRSFKPPLPCSSSMKQTAAFVRYSWMAEVPGKGTEPWWYGYSVGLGRRALVVETPDLSTTYGSMSGQPVNERG